MKDNNPDTQLEQLLASLSAHGRNQRRQEHLLEEIDRLAAAEKRRPLWPYWTSAVAASVALVLLLKPADTAQVAQVVDRVDTPVAVVAPTVVEAAPLPLMAKVRTPKPHKVSAAKEVVPVIEQQSAEEIMTPQMVEYESSDLAEAIPIFDIENAKTDTIVPEIHIIRTDALVAYTNKKVCDRQKPAKDLLGNPIVESQPLLAMAF